MSTPVLTSLVLTSRVPIRRSFAESSREVLRQWARTLGATEVERDGSYLVVRGALADGQEARATAYVPHVPTVRVSAPLDEIEAL